MARTLQILFLLTFWTLLVVAAVVIVTASFQPEEERHVRLDEQLPWCFEPDTMWVINLDSNAEVDECVLGALSGHWTQDHMEALRTVYNENLEGMTIEEREQAIRERISRFIGWKQARR